MNPQQQPGATDVTRLHPGASHAGVPAAGYEPPAFDRAAASANLVNRTHRIVRERAVSMQQRKSRTRSLWIPLGISAGLLSLISFAVWSVFDQNDATPNGLPDASSQMFVFLMWCLPLTVAILAVVWSKLNARTQDEGAR